jgi:hypothetical protein
MRKACAVAVLAAVTALAAACSSPAGPRAVLGVAYGFENSVSVKTGDEVDDGLPELLDTTRQPVHLLWVVLPPQRGVRADSVTAYRYQGSAIGGLLGNLLKGKCRRIYVPHPVTDVVVRPHTKPAWYVVVGFTLTRPGTYHVNRVKIGYRVGRDRGWQWQNLNMTVHATKARPGAAPVAGQC